MGAKIKTPKNLLGLKKTKKTKQNKTKSKKKSLDQNLSPKESHAEIPSHNKHFKEAKNDITRKIERLVLNTQKIPTYSQIICIALRVLQTSKEFWVFQFHQSSSGPLRKHIFTCDWCISIHFVCFCVLRFVACDRPVSGNNRLVFFEYFSDHSYSCLLPLTKSPLIIAISFAILEQSGVILSSVFAGQARRVLCIVICINSAPTQMIDGTEKPIRSLQTRSAIQRTLEIWSTLPSYRSLYFVMSDRGYP